MSKKALMLNALANRGGAAPEAVDFGTTDYLLKSADLTSNADGKTFTFFSYIYKINGNRTTIYSAGTSSDQRFYVEVQQTLDKIRIRGKNAAGSIILDVEGDVLTPSETWVPLLISIDMANSSNRFIYIGEYNATADATWSTYTDDSIDFTVAEHGVGSLQPAELNAEPHRSAQVFLDYTFRTLTTESERRKFYNEDLTPNEAGMDALSPILYMKLTDPSTAHINSGSGGNFTLNGTVALSGRGPNQYNAPACTFDGSADYLNSTSVTGLADGNKCTFSVWFKINTADALFFSIGDYSVNGRGPVRVTLGGGNPSKIFLILKTSNGTTLLNATVPTSDVFAYYRWHHLAFSVDLSNSGNRQVLIDGVDSESITTWDIYTDGTVDFTDTLTYVGARNLSGVGDWFDGELSDFWFDDSYTADLTGFYDTDTGKPKDLGVDGSTPTGSSPLIYLPLRGNDAGDNRGTGGDFTVNSGPFTGARGPSEFWAGSAEFDGSTQYLNLASKLTGITDTKTFSIVGVFNHSTADDPALFTIYGSGAVLLLRIASGKLTGYGSDDATEVLEVRGSTVLSLDTWYTFMLSVDLSDTGKRQMYLNGVQESETWTKYTDANMEFSTRGTSTLVCSSSNPSPPYLELDGKMGFLWFDDSYVDFSDEAVRLKFFDAFNYPVDLGADGSTPTGSQPLLYMSEGFHLGTNLGSGGNFTPVGTPTDGGHVKG